MTTRFEQIAAAFPLHAQRIAECVYEQKGTSGLDRLMCLSGHTSLLELFLWDGTEEGPDYWCALYDGRGFAKTC